MKLLLQKLKNYKHFCFSLLFILGLSFLCTAQWQNDLWVGKRANNFVFPSANQLNFNISPPTATYLSHLSSDPQQEGNSVISDPFTGDLLFYEYTNQLDNLSSIYNKQHQVMVNGDSITGHPTITQKSIIIPIPDSSDKYYLFSSTADLTYCEIDMSLDGGLGAVVVKNIPVSTDVFEKKTAVYHANKKDVWLMIDHYPTSQNATEYSAFLITNQGISAPNSNQVPDISSTGQMKFSPDGSKLAAVNQQDLVTSTYYGSLFLYDFNNQTGQISNPIDLTSLLNPILGGGYGLEFSPNSRYIYVSEPGFPGFVSSKLYQLDTEAGDQSAILASQVLIYETLDEIIWGMQLGPDGKIYIQTGGNVVNDYDLDVINNPNNAGLNCGHTPSSLTLDPNGGMYNLGLPSFIQSYFGSGILYNDDCITDNQSVSFETIRIPDITAISWDFGDGNTGTGITTTHTYSQSGTYTVTATITSNGAQQTATTEITVSAEVVAAIPADLEECQPDATTNATFDLSQQDTVILNGLNATDHDVTYHTSLNDAEEGTGAITPENSYSAAGGTTIYARLTNTTTGCYDVVSFMLLDNCFFLPQGISPNGDGRNDNFNLLAVNASYGIDKLTVFNRYGRIVYEKSNYVDEWMGQDKNGNKLPTATYFYVLQLNRPHPEFGQTIKKWVYVNRNAN